MKAAVLISIITSICCVLPQYARNSPKHTFFYALHSKLSKTPYVSPYV